MSLGYIIFRCQYCDRFVCLLNKVYLGRCFEIKLRNGDGEIRHPTTTTPTVRTLSRKRRNKHMRCEGLMAHYLHLTIGS